MFKITLAAARVNAGLTQNQAAKALNVNKKTLGKWEKGESIPKADKIDPICKLYGIPYDNIVFSCRK